MRSSLAAALVIASPDAILIADELGHYVEANPAALALLGYSREALLRLSVADIVAPGPIWAAAEYARFLREGAWQGEVEVRTSDGRVVPAEARAIVVPGPDGSCYASFLRDITDRKQAEHALQESEEHFRTAFDSAAIGMALIALDGRFLQVNPALCALTGYSEAELLARTFRDITYPDDLAADLEQVQHLVTGEIGSFQMEKRYLHKHGQVIWGHLSGAIVRDESGSPLHFIGQLEDITARKQAEHALQESEEHFRTAFDSAAIGMSLVDLDGHYLRVNAALCQLTGFSEAELLATTFQAITHPDDRELDREHLAQLLAGQIPAFQREKRYLRQDGTVVWVRVNSALVHDERGEPLHIIGQVEDITARKHAEEDLQASLDAAQAANRAKGVFLDLMSHELRTPLQAVLGYSEFLLIAPKDSLTDEQRLDISTIHQAGGRMIALVNQLLDLSRLEAGGIVLATEPVDLAQVIEAVRQDIAPQAAAKGLAVRIDVPKALPPMRGDAERLRQVLLNLAGNAVKFTPEGHIQITAAAVSGGVVVEVSDTGIGITADALLHIFEAFHQVDSSHTRRHEGSGLGLAIAWKLVRQMGGNLSVSSEPETGSTFRLHLPIG